MPNEAETAAETLIRHVHAGQDDDPVLQRFFAMAAPGSEARLAFEAVREQILRDGRPDDAAFLRLVVALVPHFEPDAVLETRSVRTWRVPRPDDSRQDELRRLDGELAAGTISADDYRRRRDEVLPEPVAAASYPEPDDYPYADRTQVFSGIPPQPAQAQQGSTLAGDDDDPWSDADLEPLPSSDGVGPEVSEDGPRRRKRTARPGRRFLRGLKSRPDRSGSTDDGRFLIAHLPGRAPQSAEISLVVRVSERPSNWAAASALLDRLTVTAAGAKVSVLVQSSPGLTPVGSLEQLLSVPGHGDSEPARFVFHARSPGLHRVRVMAFAGGTFLTEVELEVSVEPGGPAVEGEPVVATLEDLRGRPGEVTLQVRAEGDRTVFQLLSDSYLFEPVLAQASAGDPAVAVERTLDTLKQLAAGRGAYSPATAARWMQETGIGLWEQVVPGLIKEQFWQLRDQITSFTIATSHDVVPWELLHPLRPGSDHGFLVEQFPVLRRVFGQQRCHRISIAPCTYVVSGRSPANAREEIDALSAVLGSAGVVDELDELLALVSSGHCGPLHFVCHNGFSTQAGSAITMNGGPFVPALLNSATVRNSLAAKSPLVFLNACRTAGSIPEYTRMVGWAQQFMAAGAGAFVGTLWPVRSTSAGAFAETFYGHLHGGESLGQAALLARRTVIREQPDPTWLAYTVYGDPHARTP